jgi:hypothetical protein
MYDDIAIILKPNKKRSSRKYSNNTMLNDQWIIRDEIKKFLEVNENENKTSQNLWDTVKAILRGKFTAINAYITNSKISNKWPNATFQTPRKTRQAKPQTSKRSEKIKIRTDHNNKNSMLLALKQTVQQNRKPRYESM